MTPETDKVNMEQRTNDGMEAGMTLNELRAQWEAEGLYCTEDGCGTRTEEATDKCWDHRTQRPLAQDETTGLPQREGPSVTHWCSLLSDRRLVRL